MGRGEVGQQGLSHSGLPDHGKGTVLSGAVSSRGWIFMHKFRPPRPTQALPLWPRPQS